MRWPSAPIRRLVALELTVHCVDRQVVLQLEIKGRRKNPGLLSVELCLEPVMYSERGLSFSCILLKAQASLRQGVQTRECMAAAWSYHGFNE